MQRALNPKDMQTIVDDFHQKIENNVDEAKALLMQMFQNQFTCVPGDLDGFCVGRFECNVKYNENKYISKPKGFYIQFYDKKRLMNSFNKSLSEFLRFYFNPEGYYMLETVAFQLQ